MSASDVADDNTETKKRASVSGRKKNVEGYKENIEVWENYIKNKGLVSSIANKIFYNKWEGYKNLTN